MPHRRSAASSCLDARQIHLNGPPAAIVVSIWGSNFTVVKAAIEQIPPLGFKGLRLVIACVVLAAASWLSGARMPGRSDWPRLVGVGLVGHCGYQLSFIKGLARTSVANSSLILGCLPVTVLLLNAVSRRRERVGRWRWASISSSAPRSHAIHWEAT